MSQSLSGKKIKDTYQGLLKFDDNQGVENTLKTLTDGLGVTMSMQFSRTGTKFNGDVDLSSANVTGIYEGYEITYGTSSADPSDFPLEPNKGDFFFVNTSGDNTTDIEEQWIYDGELWKNLGVGRELNITYGTSSADPSDFPEEPNKGDTYFVTTSGDNTTDIEEQWIYDGELWKDIATGGVDLPIFVSGDVVTSGLVVKQDADGKIWSYNNPIAQDYPILGIAQESGIIDDLVKVAVEGTISIVQENLQPTFNYYVDANGSLSVNGNKLIGTALSDTELNIKFTNPSGITTPSLGVIDNTIDDYLNVNTPGRYVVPAIVPEEVIVGQDLTDPDNPINILGPNLFFGQENKYADYDGTDFIFTIPTDGDKISISIGFNAGNVYLYSSLNSAWGLLAQVTSLPTSNWVFASGYRKNDLVIYQNNIYQANDDIPENTAFNVDIIGETWKPLNSGVVVEYGESLLPTNVTLNNNNLFTLLTADIPSAGTWDIEYSLNIYYSGANSSDGANFWISNSSGVAVVGSGIGAYTTDGTNSTIVATRKITVTTQGATTFTVQGRRATQLGPVGTNNVVVYGGGGGNTTSNGGSSKVSWNKIGGFAPTIGQASAYITAGRSVNQLLVGQNTDIIINQVLSSNGSITLNTTTGVFTLRAGVTYNLSASLGCSTFSDTTNGYIIFSWVDANTNVKLPGATSGTSVPINRNSNESNVPTTSAIYTPSTNQTVKIRVMDAVGTATIEFYVSGVSITQLGTTNTSAFTGVISPSWNISNTYPLGTVVVNQGSLYQANGLVNAGTNFTLGTSGSTWKQLSAPVVDNGTSEYIDIGSVRMQWGSDSQTIGARNIVFPASFRDTTYTFTANVAFADSSDRTVNLGTFTTTQILVRVTAGGNASSAPIRWMAIGLKP